MDNIIKATNTYGKARIIFGSIVGTIIGAVIIIVGFYLVTRKDEFDMETIATITKSNCQQSNVLTSRNLRRIEYDCTLDITYNVNDIVYNKTIVIKDNVPKNIGSKIDVQYISNDPNIVRAKRTSNKLVGFGVIAGGVILIGIIWIFFYINRKNKLYELSSGVTAISTDTSSIVRSLL